MSGLCGEIRKLIFAVSPQSFDTSSHITPVTWSSSVSYKPQGNAFLEPASNQYKLWTYEMRLYRLKQYDAYIGSLQNEDVLL